MRSPMEKQEYVREMTKIIREAENKKEFPKKQKNESKKENKKS